MWQDSEHIYVPLRMTQERVQRVGGDDKDTTEGSEDDYWSRDRGMESRLQTEWLALVGSMRSSSSMRGR